MSCQNQVDFCVEAGSTFHPVIRWELSTLVSAPITSISQAAPAVVTAYGHGMPDGWRCAIVSVQGMTGLNAVRYPPSGSDWHKGTVVTADLVQLNEVSTADLPAYAGGGYLVYRQPASLSGVTASMQIYDNPDHLGTPLVTLTSTGGGITLDNTAKTITPLLQTAGLTWDTGYYRLQVTDGSGVITTPVEGVITID